MNDLITKKAILIGNRWVSFTPKDRTEPIEYNEMTFMFSGKDDLPEIKVFRQNVVIEEPTQHFDDVISGKSAVGNLSFEYVKQVDGKYKPKLISFNVK